jgi:hypothetical protein
MEWLFILPGLLVLWRGYKMGFASHRTDTYAVLAALASQWTEDQAQAAYLESYTIVYQQMADPTGSGIKFKTAMEHIERATAAANRVNELRAGEHGPAFRRRFRGQFVTQVKAEVDKWTRKDPLAS